LIREIRMTRKQSLIVCTLAMAGLSGTPTLLAQNLEMSTPPPAADASPSRGMSMGEVEKRFGAPAERYAAVGQPPITRWVYPDKVVYFEYDHVVHAVLIRK
jgi:hypothetical protein